MLSLVQHLRRCLQTSPALRGLWAAFSSCPGCPRGHIQPCFSCISPPRSSPRPRLTSCHLRPSLSPTAHCQGGAVTPGPAQFADRCPLSFCPILPPPPPGTSTAQLAGCSAPVHVSVTSLFLFPALPIHPTHLLGWNHLWKTLCNTPLFCSQTQIPPSSWPAGPASETAQCDRALPLCRGPGWTCLWP